MEHNVRGCGTADLSGTPRPDAFSPKEVTLSDERKKVLSRAKSEASLDRFF